jgi:hypothetical protein
MINSGIDKVKVLLNPCFLNPLMPWHIRPDNALTLHKHYGKVYLCVHAEYFNPFFDYRISIANAIYELIEKKVIDFLVNRDYAFITQMFIYQFLEWFVLGISQVEIYFDFPEGKVSINPDAIMNGDMTQFVDDDGNPQETFYTGDYIPGKRRSSFCVYNRQEKLIHDRHLNHKDIESMDVEYRIEARLTKENCPFLSLNNLSGNYETIFKKYLPFLAVLFTNHLSSSVTAIGRHNAYYSRLERKALEGKTKYFSNGKLAKSTPTVNGSDYSFEELQMMIFANYPRCMENSKNPIGIGEDDMKNGGLVNSLVENI